VVSVQTIITAAGDSRLTFLGSGFSVPKSLVKVRGRTVIQSALESYAVRGHDLTVALNAEETHDWKLDEHLAALFPQAKVVRVPSQARGALASALLSSEALVLDQPLVIAAGDSEIVGGIGSHIDGFMRDGADAATIVFESSGKRWSYVSVDSRGQVVEVSEKYQVGHMATTGVFFFREAKSFLDSATWVLMNNAHVGGAFYVSSTLNYLISKGVGISFNEIRPVDYKSWSLPVDFVGQSL